MSKPMTDETAFIKTSAIAVLLGADVPVKRRSQVLMIDPLLQEEKQIHVKLNIRFRLQSSKCNNMSTNYLNPTTSKEEKEENLFLYRGSSCRNRKHMVLKKN